MVQDRLKEYRALRGMSQDALAEAMGMPHNTISKIEHGTRKVTFEEAVRFAAILEVSLQDLAGLPASSPETAVVQHLAQQCTTKMREAQAALTAATDMAGTLVRITTL